MWKCKFFYRVTRRRIRVCRWDWILCICQRVLTPGVYYCPVERICRTAADTSWETKGLRERNDDISCYELLQNFPYLLRHCVNIIIIWSVYIRVCLLECVTWLFYILWPVFAAGKFRNRHEIAGSVYVQFMTIKWHYALLYESAYHVVWKAQYRLIRVPAV